MDKVCSLEKIKTLAAKLQEEIRKFNARNKEEKSLSGYDEIAFIIWHIAKELYEKEV